MRRLTGLIMLVATAAVASAQEQPKPDGAQPEAKKAFAQLKSLAGSWRGTIMGRSINSTIRVSSSGNALLHEATAEGGGVPDHEITAFYVEGDRLVATHYCDAGNRSRMEGKLTPDGKSVEFSLLEVVGGTQRGFLKRLMLTLTDSNTHGVEGTFVMPDGKPIGLRGEFQRASVNLSAGNKRLFDGGAMLLLLSAQKMPEEYYSFKPTEATLSFGQLLADVAEWQYRNCSAVLGEKNPKPKIEGTSMSKAELVAELKEAFAYCSKAHDGVTDASAAQLVTFNSLAGPAPMPKRQVLDTNTGLNSLHYGNLMIYMRLKNIVPPSDDPEFLRQAEKLLKK